MVSLATAQLLGEDRLAGFDRVRDDVAGQRAGGPLAVGVAGGPPGGAGRGSGDYRSGLHRRGGLRPRQGRGGLQLSGSAGRPAAPGDLGRGRAAVGRGPAGRQRRRPRARADAGYFTADLAHAAAAADCEYAVAAKRKSAFWRELAAVADDAWIPAKNMPAGQVAAIGHAPTGWPWSSAGTSTTPGRSRSSSPTSPPAPQPTSSRSRRGSVAAPTSRSGSAKPNSAPA